MLLHSHISGGVESLQLTASLKTLLKELKKVKVKQGFWWGDRRERDHWGDPDVDGRIILGWIFGRWERGVGTGWSRLRIGTGGGHL
jgi:hypothetical protein